MRLIVNRPSTSIVGYYKKEATSLSGRRGSLLPGALNSKQLVLVLHKSALVFSARELGLCVAIVLLTREDADNVGRHRVETQQGGTPVFGSNILQ